VSKLNQREVYYWSAVNAVASACALRSDPDRAFHRIASKHPMGRGQFRDCMDFGNHPSAFADWLGEPIEKFTPDDWDSVIENIAYMAFRADVMERVNEIKESK